MFLKKQTQKMKATIFVVLFRSRRKKHTHPSWHRENQNYNEILSEVKTFGLLFGTEHETSIGLL